ncbi:hypothetical protein BE20_13365 [Sorangium cellulosum]|nr:hypothetical protein BE20_13365 [Sorangium cellulosum]
MIGNNSCGTHSVLGGRTAPSSARGAGAAGCTPSCGPSATGTRRHDGGTMCPSYREEHTTRGRARLLFEMLEGSELRGFRDREVRESLDLCLACKRAPRTRWGSSTGGRASRSARRGSRTS